MIDIIPGIFEKDRESLIKKAELVLPFVEWIQLDIADNTLVSNQSFRNFNELPLDSKWQKIIKSVQIEAHLMVNKPDSYIKTLSSAGISRLIAHVESQSPRDFLDEMIAYECEAGLAIDADSELDIIEPFLEEIDVVLVMTAPAGFSGQAFDPELLEKVKVIHREYPDLPIEVDNGINLVSGKLAIDAGATRLVSTSYIFNNPEGVKKAIEKLKAL